jgi:flagellar hook-length control protein FliK
MGLPATSPLPPAGLPQQGTTAPTQDAGAPPDATFAELLAAGLSAAPAVDADIAAGGAAGSAAPGTQSGDLSTQPDGPPTITAARDDTAAAVLLAALGLVPAVPAPTPHAPISAPGGITDVAKTGTRGVDRLGDAVMPLIRAGAGEAGAPEPRPAESYAAAHELLLAQSEGTEPKHAVETDLAAHATPGEARAAPAGYARPPVAVELHTPVDVSGWDAELGRTLVWMAEGKHGVAELRLNPPDLGPLKIVVVLGGDDGSQATVTFASPHAAVRDVIESAMPRLRDMLADSGINLGQATVSAESFQQSAHPERFPSHGAAAGAGLESRGSAGPAQRLPTVRTGIGIVDIFA